MIFQWNGFKARLCGAFHIRRRVRRYNSVWKPSEMGDSLAKRRLQRDSTPSEERGESAFAAVDATTREGLLDLAYDVVSHLRHSARPAVRVSAALLLAASLAACQARAPETPLGTTPLAQEVAAGLPTQPGRYPVLAQTLMRDQQGIYHFRWLQPGETTGSGIPASASLLKLAQADNTQLEIPPSGDPTLYLAPGTPIAMTTTGGASTVGGGTYWRPIYLGGPYFGPGYYDPPSTAASRSGGEITGGNVSTAPKPSTERTYGLSRAVSGQAGGTGAGVAATGKSGAGFGGKSNAEASSGSSVSSGKSGAVSSPRSGSFSSGSGSSSSSGASSS